MSGKSITEVFSGTVRFALYPGSITWMVSKILVEIMSSRHFELLKVYLLIQKGKNAVLLNFLQASHHYLRNWN
jgi:hypothetical protein